MGHIRWLPEYNSWMNRLWTDNVGPDKKRKHSRGVAGTDAEKEALLRKGFHQETSVNGDCYYHNPDRGLIWLFPDGTWFGEKTQQGGTLQDYLTSIPDAEFEEKSFHVLQTEAGLRNDLGPMTGAELYPYVMNRVDADTASAAFSELEQKGSIKIAYTGSFSAPGTLEIKRISHSNPPNQTG
jgi:hypothetical protein